MPKPCLHGGTMGIKSRPSPQNTQLWLMSYADVVTLMLCFMVLLVSYSVVDERLKTEVLGSVNQRHASSVAFKIADGESRIDLTRLGEGIGAPPASGSDLAPLREMVVTEDPGTLNFMENRFVQIISLDESALFEPGKTTLSPKGQRTLYRILPRLMGLQYPLLVAGHTAPRMDEEQDLFTVREDALEDSTWLMAFDRARAVYRFFTANGIPPEKLMQESFGQHRPRFPNITPESRLKNRRVDLVLDKRNTAAGQDLGQKPAQSVRLPAQTTFKGFEFSLDMPGGQSPFGGSESGSGNGDSYYDTRLDGDTTDLTEDGSATVIDSTRPPAEVPAYWQGRQGVRQRASNERLE